MDTNGGSLKQGLWRRWPVTTMAGLGGVASLAAVMATGSPDARREAVEVEVGATLVAADGAEAGSRSGLYAMGGPREAAESMPRAARADSAAFAHDDADVWGGLPGTAIGESYGVGGLGLVGTGRGGGGTGAGTIGLGSRGPGSRGILGEGRYDGSLQAGVLTVGTVDDNADAAGFKKAMRRLADASAALQMPADLGKLTPHKPRHDPRPGGLDVALVVDTTGSMGDELEYLKVELRGIALEIAGAFPDVDQRWGLVVYRDDGDAYVTQQADFQGLDAFITALGTQEASGGGDTPEAMDAGLLASAQLAWRPDAATARVVFLVADAPSHAGAGARRFSDAVRQHRDAGTAIYPVGASGVDEQAELQLRVAARATGGQYIFLTDHSGVGGHHAPPKVDQFKVETLRAAMTRMIRKELGATAGGPRSTPTAPPPRAPDVVAAVAEAEPTPSEPMPPPPVLVPVVRAAEPACPGLWEELQQRFVAHLLFASSVALLVFAAMGVDGLIARRRRLLRRAGAARR